MSLGAYVRLARPFTLLAPFVGMLAGGAAALGYGGDFHLPAWAAGKIALGALSAALLNVASNAVNQIFDLEVDRINKPKRPLPAGEVSLRAAGIYTAVSYAASLAVAWLVNPTLFVIVAFTAALTYAYSGPPLRTKRHWAFANITIATPRGFLLPLAGWAAVSGCAEYTSGQALPPDAWAIATAGGLFILGAATTKDYADLEGDRAGGCITLPLRFGVERSIRLVVPFLVLPWLLVPALVLSGRIAGNPVILVGGYLLLALVGARAAWLLLRNPDALTDGSTHPAWVLMYLMMLLSQVVVGLGYALPPGLLGGGGT